MIFFVDFIHTAPGSLLHGRACAHVHVCVCLSVLGLPAHSSPDQRHMNLMGRPGMEPIPLCLWRGPVYSPTGDASVAPDTALCCLLGWGTAGCVCMCVWGYGCPSPCGAPRLDSKQPSAGWGWVLQSCSPVTLGVHRKSVHRSTHPVRGGVT